MSSSRWKKIRGPLLVNGGLALLVLIWMIPTIGLFVSSFRDRFDIQTSGWWTIFPHREWVSGRRRSIPGRSGWIATQEMDVEGVTAPLRSCAKGWKRLTASASSGSATGASGASKSRSREWAVNLDFHPGEL